MRRDTSSSAGVGSRQHWGPRWSPLGVLALGALDESESTGYAGMFAASVAALSRDPGRAHASGGQAAAGLPQLHADLLAATLASVAQARGHLPTELQADTSLAAPISQDLVAALEQPIAAGTVQVKGQQ